MAYLSFTDPDYIRATNPVHIAFVARMEQREIRGMGISIFPGVICMHSFTSPGFHPGYGGPGVV